MTSFATGYADPTDVMPRRIGAYVIDTLIAVVIIVAVAVPAFSSALHEVPLSGRTNYCDTFKEDNSGAFCMERGGSAFILSAHQMSQVSKAFYAAAIGWTLLNAVVLQGLAGGTVGKLLLGLRVVRLDGRRAGLGWCAVRTVLLLLIDALCFIIGLVVALTTKGHRRVGDMAAGTVVVPKVYEGHPIAVPGVNGPAPVSTGYPVAYGPAPSQPSGEGPTWDPARDAYIQYDRARSAWVQWDDTAGAWKPIDRS